MKFLDYQRQKYTLVGTRNGEVCIKNVWAKTPRHAVLEALKAHSPTAVLAVFEGHHLNEASTFVDTRWPLTLTLLETDHGLV